MTPFCRNVRELQKADSLMIRTYVVYIVYVVPTLHVSPLSPHFLPSPGTTLTTLTTKANLLTRHPVNDFWPGLVIMMTPTKSRSFCFVATCGPTWLVFSRARTKIALPGRCDCLSHGSEGWTDGP